MYACSDKFHEAVRNGKDQMALLIFENAVFTRDDIDVDSGIEFDDNFMVGDDLAIGQVTSNEIRFAIFNDKGDLNNFKFGEFTATIGVRIGHDTYTQSGSVVMNTSKAKYIGSNDTPYLRRNGTAVAAQPSFAVKSLLGYGGKVYAFSGDGRYAVYDDANGNNITSANTVNKFMRNKSRGWEGKGFFYNKSARNLFIYEAGIRVQYEFVPLGVFLAERPKVPSKIRIDMTCYDRMQKFEKDMPSAEELGISYPVTLGDLFAAMCRYVDVPYRTKTFTNSGATVDKKPDDFDTATMRTVLGWIAECAASNARFDRDGYLIMDWLRRTDQNFDEGSYSDFEPTWYETKKISKLYNRNVSAGKETTVGDGSEGYLIQNNPLM